MKRAHFGYSEPLRRFIQHEGFTPQVNEIQNQMPSWIPGEDHLINFQKGDPYVKVDEGYARLPGAGYEALHPELEGLDPEDYPDITKLSILGDVAPYSREYNRFRAIVEKQSHGDTDLRAQYEQIVEQVRQTKESTLQVDQRRFDAPVDEIEGTVKTASFRGIELAEYPGRTFHFSSVGSSMADIVADLLGQSNSMTRAEASRVAGADIIYTWSLRSPHIKSPRARAPDPQPPSLLVPASSKAQPVPPISPPTRPVPLSLPLPTQKSLPRAPAEPTIPPRLRSLSPRSLSICSARKGSCPTPSKNSSIRSRSSCATFYMSEPGKGCFQQPPLEVTHRAAPCLLGFSRSVRSSVISIFDWDLRTVPHLHAFFHPAGARHLGPAAASAELPRPCS
jgi:hypothetical protein